MGRMWRQGGRGTLWSSDKLRNAHLERELHGVCFGTASPRMFLQLRRITLNYALKVAVALDEMENA